jgi:NADPH:quinone reductase-like Zn-dependent oxidoreductase
MRAIGITQWGGPEVLHAVELPDPVAGPGEVAIRVHAATVNPTDTVLRSGARADRLADVQPPHVPGMDAAGTIEHVGDGVDADLEMGDRVVAIVVPLGAHGAYAERLVVPAESVVRSPAGATDAQAATLPMNGLTARQALDALSLDPGETIAVTGAAGAVGGYAMQLARAEGLRVVADAAPADEELVRSLGADVIVPRGDDFAVRVRNVVPDGVDGAVDAALLEERVLGAVRDGGGIVALRGFDGGADETQRRGIRFYPVFVRDYARQHAKLDRLRAQVEAGVLTLRVARTFPAEQAPEAHRLLEAGGVRGRIVLEF